MAALRSSRRRPLPMGWLALALVVLAVPAYAQQAAGPSISVGSGRLFASEGWEVRFSKFSLLEGDSVCFLESGARGPEMMPVSTVLRVQRLAGHRGVTFAVVGAIVGTAEGVLVGWAMDRAVNGLFKILVPYSYTEPTHEEEVQSMVQGAAIGAGTGAGFGYWLGARDRRYATVYQHPALEPAGSP